MTTRHQITCINKQPRHNPWERITHVGGVGWKRTQAQTITEIESGAKSFYVSVGGWSVDVIVEVSRFGNKYLTTKPDGEGQNNLLSLPECP